jgi:hypothetical protein
MRACNTTRIAAPCAVSLRFACACLKTLAIIFMGDGVSSPGRF